MADSVFNIAKGKVNEFMQRVDANDPGASTIVGVLLKTAQAHATLKDYDDMAALLGAGGGTANVECNFTNYARKVFTDADVAVQTPDDTNDDFEASLPNWVIAAAGGATNNSVVALIWCYDPSSSGVTNSVMVPLTVHDLSVTTDGTQLTIAPSATSFFRAA